MHLGVSQLSYHLAFRVFEALDVILQLLLRLSQIIKSTVVFDLVNFLLVLVSDVPGVAPLVLADDLNLLLFLNDLGAITHDSCIMKDFVYILH
jgi:hypothetical protein